MHFSSLKIAGISFLAEVHKDPITGLDPILQVYRTFERTALIASEILNKTARMGQGISK